MIRRGFWLAVGATAGISGYRRVSRLARSLSPVASVNSPPATTRHRPRPDLTTRRILAGAAAAGRTSAEGAAFVRDVRDGMAEYLDRRAAGVGRTLEGQRGQPPAASQRRPPR